MPVRFIGDGKPECAPVTQSFSPNFALTTSDSGFTYSNSSVAFGDPHSTRSLIYAFGYRGAALTTPAISIGGIAASVIGFRSNTVSVYIAHARVPLGTSGTVQISIPTALSIAPNGAIYRCRFLRNISAVSSGSDQNSSSTTPMSVNLSVPSHGIAIASGAGVLAAGETPAFNFSGVTLESLFSVSGSWEAGTGFAADIPDNSSYNASLQITNARAHALVAASFR